MSVYPADSGERVDLKLDKMSGRAEFDPGKAYEEGRERRPDLPKELFAAEGFFFYAECIGSVLQGINPASNGSATLSGFPKELEAELSHAASIRDRYRELYTPVESATESFLSMPRHEVDEKSLPAQKDYFPDFFQL